MPRKLREALENQLRLPGTCIFYDLDRDRCGIHDARPDVCRRFGYHKDLVCFRAPQLATKEKVTLADRPIGYLSIDFTWKHF